VIWLLDSVTIIYALNGQGRCRQRLNSAPTRGRVATSILAVAEVFYGVENSSRREENLQRVQRELELFDIYPVTTQTALIYAKIRTETERAGRTKARAARSICCSPPPRSRTTPFWSRTTAIFSTEPFPVSRSRIGTDRGRRYPPFIWRLTKADQAQSCRSGSQAPDLTCLGSSAQ
jgi:predicted nucleic acid-binding protein